MANIWNGFERGCLFTTLCGTQLHVTSLKDWSYLLTSRPLFTLQQPPCSWLLCSTLLHLLRILNSLNLKLPNVIDQMKLALFLIRWECVVQWHWNCPNVGSCRTPRKRMKSVIFKQYRKPPRPHSSLPFFVIRWEYNKLHSNCRKLFKKSWYPQTVQNTYWKSPLEEHQGDFEYILLLNPPPIQKTKSNFYRMTHCEHGQQNVCVCGCVYAQQHMCVWGCIYVWLYAPICVCTYACVRVRVYVWKISLETEYWYKIINVCTIKTSWISS